MNWLMLLVYSMNNRDMIETDSLLSIPIEYQEDSSIILLRYHFL